MNEQLRKQIFEEELVILKNKEAITFDEYLKVAQAYQEHHLEKQHEKRKTIASKPVFPPKAKKVLSTQEVRERNITWVLILGVVMVLLSGLIIATSAWDNLNNVIKTIGISLVAILFFGISWFAEKKLKIEKTAFAFWILGSLFLPVTFLSVGFFELFGVYLSISGDGKYLLGVIAAIVCMPVYVYSSIRYKNKLFAWISLTTLSFGVGFLLASFYPPIDVFYLGMIIYNSCLLAGYMKFKNSKQYKLFIQELPLFTQANLIISTLLMLAFFKDPVFYGFNIMLTAILYILIVYSHGKKEYTYVFGGLLIYGFYQVVENSMLQSVNLVVFALIGFIFLGLENYLKNDEHLKKMFRIISGVVSFVAFIYISVEGMMIRTDTPSLLLFLAYLLISINYMYLAYKTERVVFSYLAPIFLVASGYQTFDLTKTFYSFYGLPIHLFGVGVLMFLGLFVYNNTKYLKPVKLSGLLVAAGVMLLAILFAYENSQWSILSLMFFVLGIVGITVHKISEKVDLKTIGKWLMPVSWYLGLLAYYPNLFSINDTLEYSFWLVMSAIICIALNEVFKRLKLNELADCFFYFSHFALLYALTFMFLSGVNQALLYMACLLAYLYSMYRTINENIIRYSLFGAFTVLSITLLMLVDRFNIFYIDYTHVLLFVTGFIFLVWYKVSDVWRIRIMLYLLPYSIIGVLLASFETYYFNVYYVSTALIYIALALWIVKKSEKTLLNTLPLLALVMVLYQSVYDDAFGQLEVSLIYVASIILVKTVGEKLQKTLYHLKVRKKSGVINNIDWYAVTALILVLQLMGIYQEKLALEIIPFVLLPYLLYSQINRVEEPLSKRIVQTLTTISLLFPYYVVLNRFDVPRLIEMELIVLPWIVLVVFLSKRLWTDKQMFMRKTEYSILLLVSLILIHDVLVQNNAYEGILLGVLSVASIIGGMQFKRKSFFFIGLGTLAINVLVTTRGYWGNLPWWAYLLGAGLILIAVASLHEIDKNKGEKKLKFNKETLLNKFNGWE